MNLPSVKGQAHNSENWWKKRIKHSYAFPIQRGPCSYLIDDIEKLFFIEFQLLSEEEIIDEIILIF